MPELRQVPLDQIDGPERVLRAQIEQAGLIELAESIRTVGLLQPIGVVCAGERYRIVFGHRRFLACRWLGRVTIDAQVLPEAEAHEFEASTAENVVRRDLNPVEEARALRHMIDARGRTVREAAAALGRSDTWVRQRLELLLWPAELVELIASNELSVSVANELVLVEDEPARAHFLRCYLESGCTAAQMRQWRLEWQVARASSPSLGDVPAPGSTPPAPVIPQSPCGMCSEFYPITAMQFLKFCPGCVLALVQARRGEGADAAS